VHAKPSSGRRLLTGIATGIFGLALWWIPVPVGLTLPAWHLFAIFATAILAVIFGVLPILTSSVFAVGAAVLTGTLTPQQAYSGFAHPTILLIVSSAGSVSVSATGW
jgi:DASS family divalent anion:Na+ symporter